VKLAHLADPHLGYRQYTRQTPQGINQREADVALAFRRALDDVVAQEPDLVVIAGDLFHSVRPTNTAILDAFRRFQDLRTRLDGVPIVLVAGNHDTPRSVETGSILKLFEAIPGVHVVAHEPRRLVFAELDTAVLCVPNGAWSAAVKPALEPDATVTRNVIVTHREVEGVLPYEAAAALGYGGPPIRRPELRAEAFDYVALGHYHVATKVESNVWYAGALEYVTTNPWGESRERGAAKRAGQKGWLLVELGAALRVRFRPVAPERAVLDLEPIEGTGLEAADLDAAIAARLNAVKGGIDGQIVRLVVHNVARVTARELDHAAAREYKARALHFRLDLRRPQTARPATLVEHGRRRTLPALVEEYLRARALAPGVPRDRFVTMGGEYVAHAEQEEG
jgi:DNA repair exonuclease SbcCD nuclease subunit